MTKSGLQVERHPNKECIDPSADDPESWDCECQDKMVDLCAGDVGEKCFRVQMCKHPDVCKEWKEMTYVILGFPFIDFAFFAYTF